MGGAWAMCGGKASSRLEPRSVTPDWLKMAMSLFVWIVAAGVACSSLVEPFQPIDLKVIFDTSSSPPTFKILLSGDEWLRSGTLKVRDHGVTWGSGKKDKNILKAVSHTTGTGKDVNGEFNTTS